MPTSLAELDDRALIQMAVEGHGECFGELMQRHTKMVRARVVSILRKSPYVDDVLQEAFFKAWRALSTFRADATFRTWLTTIATNEALMLCRRERRIRVYEFSDQFDSMASCGEPADRAVIRAEEARAIRGALVKLPAIYREVVILRDIDEVSAAITAKRLKSTLPAVKSRLFRGRLKLAAALSRSQAGALVRAA